MQKNQTSDIEEGNFDSPIKLRRQGKVVQSDSNFSVALLLGLCVLLGVSFQVYQLQARVEQVKQKQQSIKGLAAQFAQSKRDIEGELSELEKMLGESQERVEKERKKAETMTNFIYTNAKELHYLSKIEFMKEMSRTQDFFKGFERGKVSYLLGMNSYRMVHESASLKREIDGLLKKEYERLSAEHNFNLPEEPFCLVVPTVNNAQGFRYEYNLQSLYNLNYTNFKIVIVDDVSTDSNYELIRAFVDENPIQQPVYVIRNKKRQGTLHNIYLAATQYCEPSDILALIDGDDELLGVNALKVYNSMYIKHGLEVLYGNNIINNRRDRFVRRGASSDYSNEDRKYSMYRQGSTHMFPLRSFRVSTFLKIPAAELQDENGEFFMSASDQTIGPQVLELSCGRNMYIDEFFYFVNKGLGSNDMEVDPGLNSHVMWIVLHKRKIHQCPS